MKVILQKDVAGQGKKGQMVEVSDGYARNFLIPRKLAVTATADNVNTMKQQEKARLEKEARERAAALELAAKLKDMPVHVKAKAGSGGRLFGSVTTKEISVALKEQYGVDVPKTSLQSDPIKAFGGYQVKAKLGYEVSGIVYVFVEEA
ncbi:MAG: 50S ribosomal protein L9 [Clostridiales bacterium]|nr:50S ribosomal protein L9 [Clostridiales bacterium]MCD7803458.1 50S ribosomal protein L9 [Clostridiales bacterium]MCD7881708.1 50S ribosomal protein L9 [Clostridiales bacterium]MCD8384844.1 50S ribosomal protein L9 [Clostridiales bacterium]